MRAAFPLSLRARLTISTAATLALAVCAGFVVAYFVVRGQLRGEIDSAINRASLRSPPLHARPPGHRHLTGAGRIRIAPPRLGGAAGYVQFVERGGKVSLPPGGTRPPANGRRPRRRRRAATSVLQRRDGLRRQHAPSILHCPSGQELGGRDRLSTERSRFSFARADTPSVPAQSRLAAVAAATAVGLAVSRAPLAPSNASLTTPNGLRRPETLASVQTKSARTSWVGWPMRSKNMMLDALTQSVSAQRQLVADASHELRTPLASARANLELVELHDTLPAEERRRAHHPKQPRELREMTHLIEGLVELARGDVEIPAKEPISLDHLVEEAVATAARRSEAVFRTDLNLTLVDGAPPALSGAIANLIDNAVKWSPEGASIEVSVRDGTVTVRDHGPGIDPADLPHIFDRFYRAPAARTLPGSGLGLAIVRQVAEAHGGSATAEPAPGGGFPVHPPPTRLQAIAEREIGKVGGFESAAGREGADLTGDEILPARIAWSTQSSVGT